MISPILELMLAAYMLVRLSSTKIPGGLGSLAPIDRWIVQLGVFTVWLCFLMLVMERLFFKTAR